MNLIHPSVRNSLWDSYFWRNMYWAIPCKEKEALNRRRRNGNRSGVKLPPASCRPFYLPQEWDSHRSALTETVKSISPVSVLRTSCLFLLVLVFRDITWGKLPFFNSIAFVKVFWFLPSYERVLEAPYLKSTSNYTIKTYLTPDCPLSRSCIQWSKFSGLLADLITGVKNCIANKQQGGMESVEGT